MRVREGDVMTEAEVRMIEGQETKNVGSLQELEKVWKQIISPTPTKDSRSNAAQPRAKLDFSTPGM